MDRIESLKRVDFSLFYSSIRLYLNVYQAISWLKDDILDYLWTTDSGRAFRTFSQFLIEFSFFLLLFSASSTCSIDR